MIAIVLVEIKNYLTLRRGRVYVECYVFENFHQKHSIINTRYYLGIFRMEQVNTCAATIMKGYVTELARAYV